MVKRIEISFEDKAAMKTLREKGYYFAEIANKIGCCKSMPYNIFKLTNKLVPLQFARVLGGPGFSQKSDRFVLDAASKGFHLIRFISLINFNK